MKRFKLHQGYHKVYNISKDEYEKATKKNKKYEYKGEDGQYRCFAICPACDNPIQIVSLYNRTEKSPAPYGKHYNRSIPLAEHNEQAYHFCPYATHTYNITKDARREILTDFERNIYRSVRDNFDLAIYIIEQETSLHVTNILAERMLQDYIAARGYMYYWATLYNIPWMLLYFLAPQRCYQSIIKGKGPLYDNLSGRTDVQLDEAKVKDCYVVNNTGKFLNLDYTTLLHDRKVIDDEVQETIEFQLLSRQGNWKTGDVDYVTEESWTLNINEYRFPNLIAKAQHRDQKWINMAQEIMGDI